MTYAVKLEWNVEMKTRDGTILRSDVFRPDTSEPVPAILMRTPYDKTPRALYRYCPQTTAASQGFAVVCQDIRGRYASDGTWTPMDLPEVEPGDGFDAVEWVASEPWCDGTVGMMGASYVAFTQYAAASAKPPSLKAIAPAGMSIAGNRLRTHSMALESLIVGWMAGMAVDVLQKQMALGNADLGDLEKIMEAIKHPQRTAATLPLNDLLPLNTPGMPTYPDVVKNIGTSLTDWYNAETIGVPALLTAGWYDNQGGSEMFRAMRASAATEHARTGSRMIQGPWPHTYADVFVGEMGVGGAANMEAAGVPAAHLAFFARHLRGEDVDIPVVRYFVTGLNDWKQADDWPIPGTDERRLFLRSGGRANSAGGDGTLSWDAPADESPDRFDYDPADPVPSWGFRVMYTGGTTTTGPYDQARVERRDDVLVYTSEALDRPLEVVGDIHLHLFAATSAVDTDWVVKLCDVRPDGISLNLADGMVRARYRDSWDDPSLVEPGEVVHYEIELGAIGHLFAPGHRVRVQVTSSAFPHYDRNMNTGNDVGVDASGIVAQQTVFHDASRASYVVIPVQP